MSTLATVAASFCGFLLAFTAIGAAAARHKKSSSEDYLVASRDVNPWLVALSAVSTNNSGYMFIGLIGYTWRSGVEGVWISAGWIIGDLATWFWVHRRVRERSGEIRAVSVPQLLATDASGRRSRVVAWVAAALTFAFLASYAAAQLKAGSTTLNAMFDWPMWVGSVIGAVIVAVYCLAGGIRASIWTDAAQSFVMLGAMTAMVVICAQQVGGADALFEALRAIDPSLVVPRPTGLAFGFGLYLLGYCFAGAATIGQPHVLVRFMALDDARAIRKTAIIYFTWFTYFSAAAFAVGLYARVLLPDLTAGLDPSAAVAATEGALPTLALALLPAVWVGMVLAGLFSATMSTADSQILSCSAAVTQDLAPRWSQSVRASKVATLTVALLALVIAVSANQGVFALVLIAWSALGSAFGPLLILRLARAEVPDAVAVTMMATGIATVIAWGSSPWAGAVFKAMPGMITPFIVWGVWRLLSGARAR